VPLYPRGPRSGPGYVVPVHPHLLTPCAPLAGASRFHGHRLYEMPSLCVLTATPKRPASGSVLSLAILYRHVIVCDPGSSAAAYTQFLRRGHWPSTRSEGLGTSDIPPTPLPVRTLHFGASLPFAFVTTCRFARPPVGADQAFTQPTRTFTSGLPTDWSPAPPPDITTGATGQVPLTGLSPARTPTSFAAALRGWCQSLASGRESPFATGRPTAPRST
jgi:hypothetical protein